MHRPSATLELLDIFAAYSPCFALPYDGAYRYVNSQWIVPTAASIKVLRGRYRNWRTVPITTVTYAARLDALIYYTNTLPKPFRDYENSANIYKSGGTILAPLASVASHLEHLDWHEYGSMYISIYFDWCLFGRNLVHCINQPRSLYQST